MRALDINQLHTKFHDLIIEVEFIENQHIDTKLTQLIKFLLEQPIGKRTLERMEKEYSNLKLHIPSNSELFSHYSKRKSFLVSLDDPLKQGAFAYFKIIDKYNDKEQERKLYMDLAYQWYDAGGNYSEIQDVFNIYFLKPFKDLFIWYLEESEISDSLDYFSTFEQENLNEKLLDLEKKMIKLGFGQEIIFNEINNSKELTKRLNKKNWSELIKGKFLGMALDKIISKEAADKAIEILNSF